MPWTWAWTFYDVKNGRAERQKEPSFEDVVELPHQPQPAYHQTSLM